MSGPRTTGGDGAGFQALFNFRDLGGHPVGGSRRTRSGLVFRSDGVHRCEAGDLRRLEKLGIVRVVDLRTASERETDGCLDPGHPRLEARHVPILDRVTGVGRVAAQPSGTSPTAEARAEEEEPLVAAYLEMVSTRAERIVEALDAVAGAPGPVVFHCTAGKDRTGIVAALALSAVGVDDAAVVADYGVSARAIPALVAWYRANRPEDRQIVDPARLRDAERVMGAEPRWMQVVLDVLRVEHGGAAGYLRSAGAPPGLLSALSEKLLG